MSSLFLHLHKLLYKRIFQSKLFLFYQMFRFLIFKQLQAPSYCLLQSVEVVTELMLPLT